MTYVKIEQLDPRLGRNINHDPRSKLFRVQERDTSQTTVKWTRQVGVFDQGQLGSCTGNAGVGTLGTDPNYKPVASQTVYPFNETGAVNLYSAATQLDDDPQNYPPNDTGSDGLSIAKALVNAKLISGYTHGFGIDDAFAAIKTGPLAVGTYWYNNMFNPDKNNVVVPTGGIAGGHEYSAIGYDQTTDLWEFVNSWGTGWGKAGHFFYSTATLSSLLNQQGDVILFTPNNVPAPTPVPVPTPAPVPAPAPVNAFTSAALTLDPWAASVHTGSNKKAAQAWKIYAQAVRSA